MTDAPESWMERVARLLEAEIGPHEHRTPAECEQIRSAIMRECILVLSEDGCTCAPMVEVRVFECPHNPTTLKASHMPWCTLWKGRLVAADAGPLELARRN